MTDAHFASQRRVILPAIWRQTNWVDSQGAVKRSERLSSCTQHRDIKADLVSTYMSNQACPRALPIAAIGKVREPSVSDDYGAADTFSGDRIDAIPEDENCAFVW